MPKNDVAKRLVGQLQEKYGTKSVMMASDMPKNPPISSGSLALDYAIGTGGLPSDRVIEIAGEPKTGKTTLALMAMSSFLDSDPLRGGIILDTEHKMSSDWVRQVVGEQRESRIVVMYPKSAEQATNMYLSVVAGNAKLKIPPDQVGCVIYDSIGGTPTDRRNEDYEVAAYGGNSLAITEFARVAAICSHTHRCLTIGINQVRADMSGYHQLKVPGGKGWHHAVALRLQLKKGKGKVIEKINGEDVQVGYEVACKVVQNQVGGAEGRTTSYWFMTIPTAKYGFGIDTLEEIARLGVLTGEISRNGGWYGHYLFPETTVGGKAQRKLLGKDVMMDYIRDNPEVRKKMAVDITGRLRSGDYAAEIAPMSQDPEAPITEGSYPKLLGQGDFDD